MPLIYKCAGRKRGVCDHESESKWLGRCPGCGRFYDILTSGNEEKSRTSLAALSTDKDVRISTGIKELDYVIGGGLVPGSTIIISGEPGAGKSTLLLEVADLVAKDGYKVIYASGEQNSQDIGKIAGRLGITNDAVEVMGMEGDIEKILEAVEEQKAKLFFVDSLQKAFLDEVKGAVGSAAQGNAVIEQVIYFCKKTKTCAIVVSHVNKEGEIAGSLGVSHDVDTLLEFDMAWEYDEDGDKDPDTVGWRVLNIGKNRNGPPGLSAKFELTENGVKPLKKKSRLHSV